MSSDSVSNLMKGHMESLAAEGKRADGRGINEFREVKIETGMINTAEGAKSEAYFILFVTIPQYAE